MNPPPRVAGVYNYDRRSVVAMDFPNEKALRQYLEDHPNADKSLHRVRKSEPKGIDGARSDADEPALKMDDPKALKHWKGEHTVRTQKGSLVIGVAHSEEEGSKRLLKEHVLPAVLETAEKALAAGKRVVFFAEGAKGGVEGSEQEEIAGALGKRFKGKVKQDTWDDESVQPFEWDERAEKNVLNPELPLLKAITKKVKDPVLAQAGIYAMLVGQGDALEASPEVTKKLRSFKIDPDDRKAMYRASFPQDFGEKSNPISNIAQEYNRLRQENMLRKIKSVEADGGVAIVTPGASHAYSLKPILDPA